MAKTPAKKTVGRRKPATPSAPPKAAAPAAAKHPPAKAAAEGRAPKPRKPARLDLGPESQSLIQRLSERTGLLPREVVERALAGYAAAVAPGMPLEAPAKPRGKSATPTRTLFLSVDGKPEIEIDQTEFVLGSGAEGVDLRLDLPLISARHARILWKDNLFVFEDLKSARGSYRHGQPVDVHAIETGDEIDLGGFLPVRFRLA